MALVEVVLLDIGVGCVDVQEPTIPDLEEMHGEFPLLPFLIDVKKGVGVLGPLCKRPCEVAVLVSPHANEQGVKDQVLIRVERMHGRNEVAARHEE